MKPFRFQKFTVHQSKEVFRVGTDAVLVGALCSCGNFKNILEIGCGSGIISLMIAQRNPNAEILALDIDENAVNLSNENFENSVFKGRLKAVLSDFKNFKSNEKFDFIVTNPPYFEENLSQKDVLARQTVELNFSQLIENAAKNLSENGIFSVIVPSESAESFIQISKDFNLNLVRKVNICGIENGVLKRNILEFSFKTKNLVEENFTIEKSPRVYSEQYLEATKHFHVFRG